MKNNANAEYINKNDRRDSVSLIRHCHTFALMMKSILMILALIAFSTLCFGAPAPVPNPQWVYPSYGYVPYYTSNYYTSPYYSYGYGYSSPYAYAY